MLLAAFLTVMIVPNIQQVFAVDVGPPSCVELGTCFETTQGETPFGLSMMPYQELGIGPVIYVMFWALALFMIQLISHFPMLTGMVGVIISLVLIAEDDLFNTDATAARFFYYGYILVGISIGITLFYLIKTKIHTG